MNHLSRRAFLRSSSAMVALPFLESFGFQAHASETTANPKSANRLLFLACGYGVTEEDWYPDTSQTGTDYTLPKSLQPLATHQQDITIIQNLYHRHSRAGHWGTTFWLTGANQYGIPGRSFHNTISVDQVAAETFGQNTRYSSIQLNGADRKDGHGVGSSASWNQMGKSLEATKSATELYHQLFSANNVPVDIQKKRLAKKQSILDTVLEDARSVKKGLTRSDVEKVDEYFESIREIEGKLEKEVTWIDQPVLYPEGQENPPEEKLESIETIETNLDLLIAAMQVDASRVFTYMLPTASFLPQLDIPVSPHSISHYNRGVRHDYSVQRDQTYSEIMAGLITKLKNTYDLHGQNLFDTTTVVFGSNLSKTHSLMNCPTLITGAGAGIKLGQHFVMESEKTPLCNLWLSMLHGIGIENESFGDSDGIIEDIMV